MRLVDDDGVIAVEKTVTLRFRQQNAIGHELDVTGFRQLVVEAHLVAHGLPKGRLEFLRNAGCDRSRRNTSRLCMTDQPGDPTSQFQANLGQLCGLAGAGFTADDHHLVFRNRLGYLYLPAADWQLFGVLGPGQPDFAHSPTLTRTLYPVCNLRKLFINRLLLTKRRPRLLQLAQQREAIGKHAIG